MRIFADILQGLESDSANEFAACVVELCGDAVLLHDSRGAVL
jgi:hypothetical protein